MNEQLQHSIEALSNPILRLLLYALCAAVLALVGAVVYLFRFSALKYIELSRDNIRALSDVSNALDSLEESQADSVAELKQEIHTLKEQVEARLRS